MKMRLRLFLVIILTCLVFAGCEKNISQEDRASFYKPIEQEAIDYDNPESKWSFSKSVESEHFYVFWENKFGDNPNSDQLPENMRVDIDDLVVKLEKFYDTNTEMLGFLDGGLPYGYKMQVYLLFDEDWVATGAGYDNKVGALWVSPMTCQPVGSVIAHEVGHCFQYLIYCNQIAGTQKDDSSTGFRYGYDGSNGGNTFWELCAQWQSWQDYPAEMFTDYEMDTWFSNYFRAFENEWTRYQNYWFIYYMTEKQGIECVSRIWKESYAKEDALSCYMRLYLENNVNRLYEALYEYATKAVTFDFEAARAYSVDWQGRYQTKLYETEDGFLQVAYENCPEANGFNAIPIDLKEGQSTVKVEFEGLQPGSTLATGDVGRYYIGEGVLAEEPVSTYNSYDGTAGWRYGFVALSEDGTRTYGPMYFDDKRVISFTYPENTSYLYFVVLGAPESYVCHPWDDQERNDVQMPYRIRIDS